MEMDRHTKVKPAKRLQNSHCLKCLKRLLDNYELSSKRSGGAEILDQSNRRICITSQTIAEEVECRCSSCGANFDSQWSYRVDAGAESPNMASRVILECHEDEEPYSSQDGNYESAAELTGHEREFTDDDVNDQETRTEVLENGIDLQTHVERVEQEMQTDFEMDQEDEQSEGENAVTPDQIRQTQSRIDVIGSDNQQTRVELIDQARSTDFGMSDAESRCEQLQKQVESLRLKNEEMADELEEKEDQINELELELAKTDAAFSFLMTDPNVSRNRRDLRARYTHTPRMRPGGIPTEGKGLTLNIVHIL